MASHKSCGPRYRIRRFLCHGPFAVRRATVRPRTPQPVSRARNTSRGARALCHTEIILTKRLDDGGAITYDVYMKKVPTAMRNEVLGTNPTCTWCGYTSSVLREFDADHIVPSSLGGTTTLDNLRPACSRCNRSRGNRPASMSAEWTTMSIRLRMTPEEKYAETMLMMRNARNVA